MLKFCQKVRQIARGLALSYAPAMVKKRKWDEEFASGRWNCLENMEGDSVYPFVEKYARGGSILDLGCGPGAAANEIADESYGAYTGVDISDVALEKARRRSALNSRDAKNTFVEFDIATYVPPEKQDVILFGDSLYYFRGSQVESVLLHHSKHLKPTGVFIVRIRGAYPGIEATIERLFSIVEKHLLFDSEVCVIVFRPGISESAQNRV